MSQSYRVAVDETPVAVSVKGQAGPERLQVTGRRVIFEGVDAVFYIHPYVRDGSRWSITEEISGRYVGLPSWESEQAACEQALLLLQAMTAAQLNQKIGSFPPVASLPSCDSPQAMLQRIVAGA